MPRRNRVDPWGDLHAVDGRGLYTGNRGCLVNDHERVVRHHAGSLWITCLTSFRGRRYELARPGRWTPIFFLDEAVALAAGHRPCAYCRRPAYRAYRDAVAAGDGALTPGRAGELDRRLHAERLRRGRGLVRAGDRLTWSAAAADLPDGVVVVVDGAPHLLVDGGARPFGFDGWVPPVIAPAGDVAVLTPPTSVRALAHGYEADLHPSARDRRFSERSS